MQSTYSQVSLVRGDRTYWMAANRFSVSISLSHCLLPGLAHGASQHLCHMVPMDPGQSSVVAG